MYIYIFVPVCYNTFIGGMDLKTSDAQMRASIKYAKANLKRIPLDVKIEKYNEIKKYADMAGLSFSGFIKEAIEEKIARARATQKESE